MDWNPSSILFIVASLDAMPMINYGLFKNCLEKNVLLVFVVFFLEITNYKPLRAYLNI